MDTAEETNNQAEWDRRMLKVQQEISGIFGSDVGMIAFCCIRSSLSLMRKQGRSMLAALSLLVTLFPLPGGTEQLHSFV